MSATLSFVETLKREVGRMQALHPERANDLSRACALVMQGMVLPSPDDPATAHVLSSDGAKHYAVNGHCSCPAGEHGKDCKHQHAWKLYQFITKKMEALPPPEVLPVDGKNQPLPEAPASANVRLLIDGHETQITLRDSREDRLLDRLHALLKRQDLRPLPPKPAATKSGNWKPRGR